MNILVTNDDGIYSPGLWAVASALRELGSVTVVAPDRDKSGVGPAMTLLHVVRATEIASHVEGIRTVAVEGTPADCVILAAEQLIRDPIDLVVSGANQGSNLGLDVLTSGTVGGAFQGYFRNIPSIAVSVASLTDVQYEAAARTTRFLARAIKEGSLAPPLLLNVNLPNTAPDSISRVEITRLGPRVYLESATQGFDGRRTHYWIKHNRPSDALVEEGTDVWAVRNNRVSITPMDLVFRSMELSPQFQSLADKLALELGVGSNS